MRFDTATKTSLSFQHVVGKGEKNVFDDRIKTDSSGTKHMTR